MKKSSIHSLQDARNLAKKKLPSMIFDYVDGIALEGDGDYSNSEYFRELKLSQNVLAGGGPKKISKRILGQSYDLPFGIAPMGMCNLTWPGADKMLAEESLSSNVPMCVSMASSTSLEKMYEFSKGNVWLQLYNFQDEEFVMELLDRAERTGYKVAILTVDVPIQFRRAKDNRNGFNVPFNLGLKQFIDFATHPNWSISTLLSGIPKPMNYETSKKGNKFVRSESRGATDWDTLKRIREKWKGKLIIKGVMSSEDAIKIKSEGADAIQVSNHGGRQLDSALSSIEALPLIRNALGKDFPIIFDSGIRGGSDVVRALAMGADFTMIGRPLMYGIGADGAKGLKRVVDIIKDEISTALGLVGLTDIKDISSDIISERFIRDFKY